MIKAILFDLDGTLLPMNEEIFTKGYFSLLSKKMVSLGYDKDNFISAVMFGTKAMRVNNGEKSNKNVFWENFISVFGGDRIKIESDFTDFYNNEFKESSKFCGENSEALKVVQLARKSGFKTILASNPLFPKEGMLTRLGFVNISSENFDYISTYDNSSYSKPNTNYYLELLKQNNLKANEVIYIANSKEDDLIPAQNVGIKTFLVGEQGIKITEFENIIKNIN